MSKALTVFESKGPTILWLLIAGAMPEDERPKHQLVDSEAAPDSPASLPSLLGELATPVISGGAQKANAPQTTWLM